MKPLFFDTETSGLPLWKEPSDHPGQPRIVSLAAELHDSAGGFVYGINTLIKPDGWVIGEDTIKIHGITNERALDEGRPIALVMDEFMELVEDCDVMVGHNISFDMRMLRIEMKRMGIEKLDKPTYCTMQKSTSLCDIKPTAAMEAAGFIWPKNPKLAEACLIIFGEPLEGAHNSGNDMKAASRLYYHLKSRGI